MVPVPRRTLWHQPRVHPAGGADLFRIDNPRVNPQAVFISHVMSCQQCANYGLFESLAQDHFKLSKMVGHSSELSSELKQLSDQISHQNYVPLPVLVFAGAATRTSAPAVVKIRLPFFTNTPCKSTCPDKRLV